ncbi:HAMP domain-containing histidine kinase [Candidatus Kaiserbacteria bacterium]|nr:MAG: HAMP domain-containing histidine kinase [Candidatus Kaiserbacteria bacterium]
MIQSAFSLIISGYRYVRKHPELLMTIVLMCVIPIAFVASGLQFLNAARDNQERLEKDRIGMMHDVYKSLMDTAKYDQNVMQSELTRIAQLNEDIINFVVARENGPYLDVVASLDISQIGTIVENPTEYRVANADPNRSTTKPQARDGVRYWLSYRVVKADTGDDYYIFTETSLVHTDALFASRIINAYYWLFGLLAVVLLLVLRHVRLIDYSYLYAESKKANEMKDMFTNMIAHELRAPLTAMRGFASMIVENKDVSDEMRKYAHNIEDAAERLVLVVNDLLDVARIHSGKLSITSSDTNIQEVVSAVLEIMQPIAKEKNIALTQDTKIYPINKIYPIKMFIDKKRFHQALTNLVSNAIKYTQAGSITLSIEDRDDRLEIRVKDTGMGISAENQKNLFAPFFRVQIAEVDNTVGTGLGMWITKQLIELMGGSIAVESIKGVGTHVVITLPKVTYLREPHTSK